MNKTKGNLVLIGEAMETGWADGEDRRIWAGWPAVEIGGYG